MRGSAACGDPAMKALARRAWPAVRDGDPVPRGAVRAFGALMLGFSGLVPRALPARWDGDGRCRSRLRFADDMGRAAQLPQRPGPVEPAVKAGRRGG